MRRKSINFHESPAFSVFEQTPFQCSFVFSVGSLVGFDAILFIVKFISSHPLSGGCFCNQIEQMTVCTLREGQDEFSLVTFFYGNRLI